MKQLQTTVFFLIFHAGIFKIPWHIGDGKAVYIGKTFKGVEAWELLQLWYDFI